MFTFELMYHFVLDFPEGDKRDVNLSNISRDTRSILPTKFIPHDMHEWKSQGMI